MQIDLDDKGESAHVRIDAALSAPELQALALRLGLVRAGMQPPADDSLQRLREAPVVVEDASALAIDGTPRADGRVVWRIFSECFGWLAFALDARTVGAIAQSLSAQAPRATGGLNH